MAILSERVWRAILVMGMLITGSINTLSKRAQNQSYAVGIDGTRRKFVKPWGQTLMMFAGEICCLLLFVFCIKQTDKKLIGAESVNATRERLLNGNGNTNGDEASDNDVDNDDDGEEVMDTNRPRLASAPGPMRDAHARIAELEAQQRHDRVAKQKATPFYIFALPALCDLLGTTLGGIGLLWVDGSVWQMLRGSIIIFSGILSIVFLKRKFFAYHWISIGFVTCGLAIIGIASWMGQQHKKVVDEDNGKVLLGFIFIVAGQLCSASQMIVEETFVKNRDLHPAHVVGLEGTWGAILMIFGVLPFLWWLPGSDNGSYESAPDALVQLSNNGSLLSFVFLYFCSTACFNFFSLSVAKSLSTIHRTLIDAMRTLFIWSVDLFIYYNVNPSFGEEWTAYSPLQLAGFGVLVTGTLMYNQIIKIPGVYYPEPTAMKPLIASVKRQRAAKVPLKAYMTP